MVSGLSVAVLLLSATCSVVRPAGVKVNCSSLALVELSHLPSDATELHLQDNRLTSVPPGLFDKLVRLEKVSLSGNPFHCDCRIQYLRTWLLKNRAMVSEEPTCSSPESVAKTAISQLGDDFFSSCAAPSCGAVTVGAVTAPALCCLAVLLLWSVRLAKASTITLYIDARHSGLEAESLRSLRPKHRRRLLTGGSEVSQRSDSFSLTEDLEQPLINADLQTHMLDAMRKRHKRMQAAAHIL